MINLDLVEAKQQYTHLKKKFNELVQYIDVEKMRKEITEYENRMSGSDFWNDQKEAKKIIEKGNNLKDKLSQMEKIQVMLEDFEILLELYEESDDDSFGKEMNESIKEIRQKLNDFEIELLLGDDYDRNNAIMEIHPGAGGTESQDWGEMLLRMYNRYAENKGFSVETLDYLAGDEAGIKSVTLLIKGTNAYGYLKAEKGVHRLVRMSPFDSSGRRHTSFASVDVMPELDDDIEVEIKTEDLKIDTFRSSGAGGQHVNTTDSAIRITHLPSGIVVSCQQGRSQISNRETALKMLKIKIYQLELQKQKEHLQDIRGEMKEIGWGSQIRSYVFHPYSLVKDHRTNAEVGNVQAVMDGNIETFINEYLRYQIKL